MEYFDSKYTGSEVESLLDAVDSGKNTWNSLDSKINTAKSNLEKQISQVSKNANDKFNEILGDSTISRNEVREFQNELNFIRADFVDLQAQAINIKVNTLNVFAEYKTAYGEYYENLNEFIDYFIDNPTAVEYSPTSSALTSFNTRRDSYCTKRGVLKSNCMNGLPELMTPKNHWQKIWVI